MRFMNNSMWSFLVYPSSAAQVKHFWSAWEKYHLDSEENSCTTILFVSHQVSCRG